MFHGVTIKKIGRAKNVPEIECPYRVSRLQARGWIVVSPDGKLQLLVYILSYAVTSFFTTALVSSEHRAYKIAVLFC